MILGPGVFRASATMTSMNTGCFDISDVEASYIVREHRGIFIFKKALLLT